MIRFNMFKINVEQFAILADNSTSNEININTELNLKYSINDCRIATVMTFTFDDAQQKIMLLKLCCEFNILKEDWKTFIHDNKIIIPKEFIDYLIAQTVGTARGVLHCKTEGTPFNHIILPPLDVTHMMNENMVIPLSQNNQ